MVEKDPDMAAPDAENPRTNSRSNRRVVYGCVTALAVMTAITAVSPKLYSIFCQVTGYAGTTQRAEGNSGKVLDRIITVRFDGNVAPNLPWKFEPEVETMDVKIGETALAFFRATNTSDKPVTGQAAFNVAPQTMGLYFQKIECFCFKEQTLQPNQTVEMPVTFFVDPKIKDDPDARGVDQITLSYTFHVLAEQTAKGLDQARTGG
jgi:cytochrome c oxidase assembly protein subunit 11